MQRKNGKFNKTFWSCVKGAKPNKPKLPVIQVREGVLSSDIGDRRRALDNHLKRNSKRHTNGN